MFAIFLRDTAGMKTCSGIECFGLIVVWMTKTQQNNILQTFHNSYFDGVEGTAPWLK
jgi:hypothetical protein